jgi:hypothetical protein
VLFRQLLFRGDSHPSSFMGFFVSSISHSLKQAMVPGGIKRIGVVSTVFTKKALIYQGFYALQNTMLNMAVGGGQ